MKVSTNTVSQVLMMALQALNQASDVVPPKARLWVAMAISAVQFAIGIVAHYSPVPEAPKPLV